jgi:hypothetical protein
MLKILGATMKNVTASVTRNLVFIGPFLEQPSFTEQGTV